MFEYRLVVLGFSSPDFQEFLKGYIYTIVMVYYTIVIVYLY